MIDTDKYEGHIQGEWRDTIHEGALAHHIVAYNPQISYANDAGDVKICTVEPNEATANLVTDAPLLLEEVKRLREELRITQNNFSMVRNALANQYPEIEEAIWKVIE
tara:strand:- start:1533 stop:1853 length:321 start_codon:yes stop_codon:yes gene_type:complete